MRKYFILCSLFLCVSLSAKSVRTIYVEIENVLKKDLKDVPVALDLKSIPVKFDVKSAVVQLGDMIIPSQLDDLDEDCRPDEVAFVADIPASSKRKFSVMLNEEYTDGVSQPSRVFATLLVRDKNGSKPREIKSVTVPGDVNFYNMIHGHGPMLESEFTGYRIYFNAKQTIDPYGKFNKGLELEQCLFYPSDAQLANGFGDDVLKVGNSCGVGALKGWNGSKATHIEPVAFRTEKILAKGPVRAIAEVDVKGWEYQGAVINMKSRYTLYAGHRELMVETFFDRPLGSEKLCTGVQNVMGDETLSYSDHKGLVGSWGRYWPVNDTVKYAKETIGIATYIPRRYVKEEVKDKDNFLYVINSEGKQYFRYYTMFTSKKETFGFESPQAWFEYIQEWKEELSNPVKIKVIY